MMMVSEFPQIYYFFTLSSHNLHDALDLNNITTVVPTRKDSDILSRLQLLSKTSTCTPHLRQRESIDHLCINPILRIGPIHK